jgi:hypothetical protein
MLTPSVSNAAVNLIIVNAILRGRETTTPLLTRPIIPTTESQSASLIDVKSNEEEGML